MIYGGRAVGVPSLPSRALSSPLSPRRWLTTTGSFGLYPSRPEGRLFPSLRELWRPFSHSCILITSTGLITLPRCCCSPASTSVLPSGCGGTPCRRRWRCRLFSAARFCFSTRTASQERLLMGAVTLNALSARPLPVLAAPDRRSGLGRSPAVVRNSPGCLVAASTVLSGDLGQRASGPARARRAPGRLHCSGGRVPAAGPEC